MRRFLLLAVLAAATASMFGVLGDGGGKAEAVPQYPFVNVAASQRGTVVRIDVNTLAVVGEYITAPQDMGRNPSRTTVDQYGAVWVANRDEFSLSPAVGGTPKGSVTRIGLIVGGTRTDALGAPTAGGQFIDPAGSSTNTCHDRDGDGLIKTSTGLSNILDWTNAGDLDTHGGVATAEDECIINYTRVTGAGTRTVAVDSNNNVWVGGRSDTDHEKLNGAYPLGVTTGPTSTSSGQPIPGTQFNVGCGGYGGLVWPYLGQDILWSAQDLVRAETSPLAPVCIGDTDSGNYGIGVDCNTGHIWYSSVRDIAGSTDRVYELDPADGSVLNSYPQGWPAQGVAVDRKSHVWLAQRGGTEVLHLAPDPSNPGQHYEVGKVTGLAGTTGVAVDVNGNIWASEYGISESGASMIDPDLGAGPDAHGNFVGAIAATVSIGPGAGPYNYSDMTGLVSSCITEVHSQITICKQTDPDGSIQLFNFDLQNDEQSFVVPPLQDDECHTITADTGDYFLEELVGSLPWDIVNIECIYNGLHIGTAFEDGFTGVAFTLQPGASVICTFTNRQGDIPVGGTTELLAGDSRFSAGSDDDAGASVPYVAIAGGIAVAAAAAVMGAGWYTRRRWFHRD